jgi:hypothetical protein
MNSPPPDAGRRPTRPAAGDAGSGRTGIARVHEHKRREVCAGNEPPVILLVANVVVAEPHPGNQIGGVADEPRVPVFLSGSGLSRSRAR